MKSLFHVLFTLAGLACIPTSAQDQSKKVKFMDHLSVSIEAAYPTGFGLEVATTLHPNFMLRAGFTVFPPVSATYDTNVSFRNNQSESFDEIVKSNPQLKEALLAKGLPTNSKEMPQKIKMKEQIKMYNGKILVDYYPSSKKVFHITAGVYFGNTNWSNHMGSMPSEYMEAIHVMNGFLPENEEFTPGIWDGTWIFSRYYAEASPSGKVNYSFNFNPVKPYLGIGFGRAVPNKRFGCQIDLGVICNGKQRTSGKYYGNDIFGDLIISRFFPTLSVRLIGRIF